MSPSIDPLLIARDLTAAERKAMMHREGASADCLRRGRPRTDSLDAVPRTTKGFAMTRDTEDVVARLAKLAKYLAGHNDGICRLEADAALDANQLIQSLSDRIDELRAHLFDVSIAAGKLIAAADGIEKLRPERKAALIAIDAASAALHQEGITP